MDILIDNPILSAFMQSAQVERNIEAEALRKAEVKERTAKAMNRADNEWR